MDAKTLKKLFKSQMEHIYRLDQKFTFIELLPFNEKHVHSIAMWKLGCLVEDFEWNKKNQEGHILPVLTRKR